MPQFEVTCSAGTITYKAASDGAGNAVALVQSTGLAPGKIAPLAHVFVFLALLASCLSVGCAYSLCSSCTPDGMPAQLSGKEGLARRRHGTRPSRLCQRAKMCDGSAMGVPRQQA